MNWTLLLFVLVGSALMFVVDWVKEGKAFNPTANLPLYVLSFLVGGVLAFFIKESIVQALLLVLSQLAFASIYRGIKKVSQ